MFAATVYILVESWLIREVILPSEAELQAVTLPERLCFGGNWTTCNLRSRVRVIKKKLKAASAQQDVVRPQAKLTWCLFQFFLYSFIYLFKLGCFLTRLRPTVSHAKPRNSTFKLLCMNFLGNLDTVHTVCLVESRLTDIGSSCCLHLLSPSLSSIYYYMLVFRFNFLINVHGYA